MKIKYKIPSKTFLLGEYSVLFGGDAILMATKPLFEIIVDTDKIVNDANMIDFSQERDDIIFVNTCDGFGKSSAGFLALYNSTYNDFEIENIVRLYKGLSNSKIKPSCADIVSQIIGGLTFFDGSLVGNSCQFGWLFSDVEIMIFKTNTKITTYKHLSENINIQNLSLLCDIVQRAKNAILTKSAGTLAAAINDYHRALLTENLVIKSTKELIEKIINIDGVLAAKGCGASCADAIITLNYKNASASIREDMKNFGLSYIANTDDFVGGMSVVR